MTKAKKAHNQKTHAKQDVMAVKSGDMLQFVDVGQSYPDKRAAQDRAKDFAEISARYNEDAAETQSSRCSQCGVPYCSHHCPLHNHIPDWLRLTAEGRLREAYEMSSLTSTMPEICGRICPQDRLCEGNCVIEFSGHDAVTIGSVEKYITDTAWEKGWVEPVNVGRNAASLSVLLALGLPDWRRRNICAWADMMSPFMTGMTVLVAC